MSYIPSLFIEIYKLLKVHANYPMLKNIYIPTHTPKYSGKSRTTQNHNIDTLTTRWRLFAEPKIQATSFYFQEIRSIRTQYFPLR